jgi:hypothetical protein
MAGGKGRGKLARYYFTLMVLCAIAYLISQLAKKKLQQKYTIILVVVLLLVVLTNPALRIVKHPIAIAVMVGVPILILMITCATIVF